MAIGGKGRERKEGQGLPWAPVVALSPISSEHDERRQWLQGRKWEKDNEGDRPC